MKLLFDASNPENGVIYYAVKDDDYKWFEHTTNIPLTVFSFDEFEPEDENYEPNMEKAKDLLKYGNPHKVDSNGDPRFYVEYNETTEVWKLVERDNWEEVYNG